MADHFIILDSNFILVPIQFKIDYLKEILFMLEGDCKFLVFKQVIDELEAKSHRSESTIFSNQYRAGMTYLKNNENEYKVIMKDDVKSNDETTDDFILRQCNVFKSAGYRIYLATNDTELRRKAKRKDIDTIFVRQKKYLSMD